MDHMQPPKELVRRRSWNWLGLGGALALLLICLLYALPAAISGNLLFPIGVINKQPAQIFVYVKGETYLYRDC
jgi:hypothetical protein